MHKFFTLYSKSKAKLVEYWAFYTYLINAVPFYYLYFHPWSISKWKLKVENLFRIKSVKIFDKIPLGGLRFINLETSLINIPEINDLKQLKSAQWFGSRSNAYFQVWETLKLIWLADNGSCTLTILAVWRESCSLIFKRRAKQMYYICMTPIRLVDYESSWKNATHTASKPMSNCVK